MDRFYRLVTLVFVPVAVARLGWWGWRGFPLDEGYPAWVYRVLGATLVVLLSVLAQQLWWGYRLKKELQA